MWDNSKSLLLTVWWMRIALIAWCALLVIVPLLFWVQWITMDALLLFGVMFVPLFLVFRELYKLLHNIQQGIVFSVQNTASLRLVSWACFFAAVFLLIAAIRWPILLIVSGVIGFLGLFVRVIKNVLAEAIILKEENAFTI